MQEDFERQTTSKTLFDLLIDELRRITIEHHSTEGKLDQHWKLEFPIIEHLLDRVWWVVRWRRYCTPEILNRAVELADKQEKPSLSKKGLDDLCVAYWGRSAVLKLITTQPCFPEHTDLFLPKTAEIPYSKSKHIHTMAYIKQENDFMEHCWTEMVHRIKQSAWNVESFRYTTLGRQDAALNIQKMTSKLAKDLMPDGSDWENTASNAFVKWWEEDVPKLQDEPFHTQMQKLGITKTAIKRNIIDERRKKKQQPEEISLDTVEKEHIPTFKMLFPSSQPEETVEPLTDWQISQLDEIFGEIGRKIIVYIWNNSYLVDEDGRLIHGVKKKIAKAVGCDASTVGEYFGTTNKVGKFQLHRKEIHEIL